MKWKVGDFVKKRIIILLLAAVMLLVLSACGIKKKINEKISEKITEGVLNKLAGDDAKVDLEEGGLTIKGEDGKEVTFGSSKWPKGKAADLIPEFKKGKIISVMNSDDACGIMLEEVEEEDFADYLEKIKGKGFTNDTYEASNDTVYNYGASLDDKASVFLHYGFEDKTFSITVEVKK